MPTARAWKKCERALLVNYAAARASDSRDAARMQKRILQALEVVRQQLPQQELFGTAERG